MNSFADLLRFLHGLNLWLALCAGVWTLALVLPGIAVARPFASRERHSLTVFMVMLLLQAGLGMLLLAAMSAQHILAFSGRPIAQWFHIGAGVLAVMIGLLAVHAGRVFKTNRARFWAAALTTLLALLLLGQTVAMLAMLAALLLARFVMHKLRSRRSAAA